MEELSGGARQAALLVHGLHRADAQWLLDAIDPLQRSQVQALVDELRALGIPSAPGAISRSATVTTASPARRLAALALPVLADVLRREPPMLVARVLSLGEPEWRSKVLDLLGPVARRPVAALLPGLHPPAPRLAQALLEQVVTAVQQSGASGKPAAALDRPAGWRERVAATWLGRVVGGRQ